jgi:hypothetical protein
VRKQVVTVPLGGIGETWGAVRDRIEVSGHGSVWQVTAGSFESALDYARERFGDPVVLDRTDRHRWWPRVTLLVSTDPAMAASAPELADLARPAVPAQRTVAAPTRPEVDEMPVSLEAIFSHQEQLRG